MGRGFSPTPGDRAMRVGSLGDVIFEAGDGRLMTPSEFQADCSARFEEHKVVGAPPRLEFLSAELTAMSLPIRLRADMGVNPAEEAEKLVALCREGKVARLILAGRNMGDVVIESVTQTWRLLAPNGQGPYLLDQIGRAHV